MIAEEAIRMVARRVIAAFVLALLAVLAVGVLLAALPSCVVGEITGGPVDVDDADAAEVRHD